jgi:hypothetical protein
LANSEIHLAQVWHDIRRERVILVVEVWVAWACVIGDRGARNNIASLMATELRNWVKG